MIKIPKMILKGLLLSLLSLLLTLAHPAQADQGLELPAQAGIAIDVRTGKILYEKDADKDLPVATLSRLLTLYLVYDAVKEGTLSWDQEVAISNYAFNLSQNPETSTIPFTQRTYTVEELTKASIISASNSAAIALAEELAGSEEKFVDRMRKLLASWGISDSLIVNASGLNNYYLGFHIYPDSGRDEENSLSARDLAIVSQKLLTDFPEILDFSQATRGNFADQHLFTYNYLLENMPFARANAYGLATGSSELAGSSLISLSYENGMQVLAVILNVDGGLEDSQKRFEVANDFLDGIKERFHLQKVLASHTSFNDTPAPVLDGKQESVEAVAQDDFYVVTTPDTTDKVKLVADFPPKTNYAPIADEQVVGRVIFEDQALVGQGYLNDLPSIPLIANTSVERANLFQVMWNAFVRYVLEYL